MHIDQSIQYLFAMKYSQPTVSEINPFESKVNSTLPKGFNTFVYQAYPLAKHKIQLRLENLYDLFDTDDNSNATEVIRSSKPQYIDMFKFARALWQEANPRSHRNV